MLKFAVRANIQVKHSDGPGSGGRPDVGWVSPCCCWQLRACLNLFWEFGERSPPEEGGACGLRRRLGAAHTHPSGVSAELTAFSLLRRALCVPRQCLSDSWIGSLLQWASVCEDLGKRWDGGRGTLLKGKARGSSATVLWNAWNPLTERGPFHALEVDIHLYFPLADNLIVKFISLLIFLIISSITISYNVKPADAILHLYSIYCIMADPFPILLYYTDLRSTTPLFSWSLFLKELHYNMWTHYWITGADIYPRACASLSDNTMLSESLVNYGNNYLARLVRHWSLKKV